MTLVTESCQRWCKQDWNARWVGCLGWSDEQLAQTASDVPPAQLGEVIGVCIARLLRCQVKALHSNHLMNLLCMNSCQSCWTSQKSPLVFYTEEGYTNFVCPSFHFSTEINKIVLWCFYRYCSANLPWCSVLYQEQKISILRLQKGK